MQELDDNTLLREYVERNSEEAFAALVARHVNKVYSVAVRYTGNPHQAEEITQAVFVILARKSRRLGGNVILSGWLHQTARLTAITFIRSEVRRVHREQEAHVQTVPNENQAGDWPQIAPLLDEAMARLNKHDRYAVVLRFFDGKSMREIGAALGTNETSARKRVSRAVEKMQKFFIRRGIASTTTAIAETISARCIQLAPSTLTKSILTVALAKEATTTAPILPLVKGTMKTMAWIKFKFAACAGGTILLVGAVTTMAISQTSGNRPTALQILQQTRNAYARLSSYSDSGTEVFKIGSQNVTTTFHIRLERPNRYRIDWNQTTLLSSNKGVVWSNGNGNNLQVTAPVYQLAAAHQTQNDKPQKMPDMKTALARAIALSGSTSSTIPGIFFDLDLGDFTAPAASGRYPLTREPDAKIGNVDCYVVSSGMMDLSKLPAIRKPGKAITTFWIGKQDHLIHQSRVKYFENVESIGPTDQAVDDAIKQSLAMQHKPVTPEAIAAMRPHMKQIMQQVHNKLKSSFESGIVQTQTHKNIVTNQKYSPTDFTE